MKSIIVIESGFVYVGELEKIEHEILGESIIIKAAQNIRRWGTNKGLGQLAMLGVQKETVLDYVGTITVPIGKILHVISVNPSIERTFNDG